MIRKTLTYSLLYGAALGLLSVVMVWSRYRLVMIGHTLELYLLLTGVVFIGLGAWLGRQLTRPRTLIRQEIIIREVEVMVPAVAAPVPEVPAAREPAAGISQRELEVLQLLARGMSNEEIAAQLFVSQNTVKTHLSNLYTKLDVKRRTQAVDKARSMGLLG